MKSAIEKGLYRHFKGNVYNVLGVAKNSETLELLVLYSRVEHPDELWVRPLGMFNEIVIHEGVEVQRFTRIS